ncbi:MAG: hypothetical protein PHX13_01765 [Thiovulaceae bacterium]|nr:hypothetical protein [Sulfurimonadaceae bacterium]
MQEEYKTKARLIDEISDIEQYRPILEKDCFKKDEPHWRSLSKNTITLFQVLIDQDMKDLVNVLNHYPQYTEWVCEHFRYAYSYSENEADISATSDLLFLGEQYFSKQFVRNVVRKLPKIDDISIEEVTKLALRVEQNHIKWHPIVTNYFLDAIARYINMSHLHPLQRIVVMKPIRKLEHRETYIYDADDRDAVLDIPYMN